MSISLPTYTRREIPLQGRRQRTWAIVATGLRREIRRPAGLFAMGVGTAVTTITSIVLVLFAPFLLRGQKLDLSFFFQAASNGAILFFVVLMAGVVGSGLIADDLDSMALTLYLSRPVTAADYLTAKAAIVGTLTLLVAVIPMALTPIVAGLLGYFPWDIVLEAVAVGIGLGFLLAAFFASLSLLLSSLTRRRAYAAAALFALVFGLIAVQTILSQPGSVNDPSLLYLSPWEDFLAVARAGYGVAAGPIAWASSLAILLGVTVIAAAATWFRMRGIEVVSG